MEEARLGLELAKSVEMSYAPPGAERRWLADKRPKVTGNER
jgi:hypothetical protein